MKKTILYILQLCFFYTNIFSNPLIYKIWIGENLEYLELTKEKAKFDYGYNLESYGISYKEDILTLMSYFYVSGKIGRRHDDYKYKILLLTDDSLVVAPINNEASRLIKNQNRFVFIDKSKLNNPNLQFQKIFFSGTPCFGSCPGMKIEIDSSGQIHFLAEYNTGIYQGLYKGQLNKKQLDKLIEILKVSELDRFPIGLGGAVDAPIYNFKFYYNNKIKTSKGSFVPYFNASLLNYMLNIYKEINFKKLNNSHEFEK